MTDRSETGGVGERLKRTRESKRVTLRQIANTTRIAVSALDAIERNDIKKLPGGIFARSFVRAYASELKLDVEQTVSEFFAQFPEAVEGPTPPSIDQPDTLASRLPGGILRAAMLAVPAVALVAWMLFGSRAPSRHEPPPLSVPVPAAQPEVAPPPPARSASDVVPAGGALSEPVQAPEAQASPLTLHLTARAECWVSITADGREVVSRLMGVGEEEAVRAVSELRIKVGDASAVGLRLNGSPVRPLGRTGQVVSLRIDSSNVADLVQTH
jgi:cytoskeleton protein RodZ